MLVLLKQSSNVITLADSRSLVLLPSATTPDTRRHFRFPPAGQEREGPRWWKGGEEKGPWRYLQRGRNGKGKEVEQWRGGGRAREWKGGEGRADIGSWGSWCSAEAARHRGWAWEGLRAGPRDWCLQVNV